MEKLFVNFLNETPNNDLPWRKYRLWIHRNYISPDVESLAAGVATINKKDWDNKRNKPRREPRLTFRIAARWDWLEKDWQSIEINTRAMEVRKSLRSESGPRERPRFSSRAYTYIHITFSISSFSSFSSPSPPSHIAPFRFSWSPSGGSRNNSTSACTVDELLRVESALPTP